MWMQLEQVVRRLQETRNTKSDSFSQRKLVRFEIRSGGEKEKKQGVKLSFSSRDSDENKILLSGIFFRFLSRLKLVADVGGHDAALDASSFYQSAFRSRNSYSKTP